VPNAPFPPDENDRVSALYEMKILDTPPEERFDRLSRLASTMFGVPIAYVALLERDRQWFKSSCGLGGLTETPRETSLCSHTVLSEEPIICPDTMDEPRFCDNPYVLGAPNLRFYMGHPLTSPDGYRVGTFCVADVSPRPVTEAEVSAFRDLARAAESELNLVDSVALQRDLRLGKEKLREAYGELAAVHEALRESQLQLVQSSKMAAIGQLAGGVAHELNTPLASILMGLDSTLKCLPDRPERAVTRLERARHSVMQMKEIVSKLLFYSRDSVDRIEETDLNAVVHDTLQLVGHQLRLDGVDVELDLHELPILLANSNQLQQVVTNLLMNARDAILMSPDAPRRIQVRSRVQPDTVVVCVQDWGPGVSEELQQRIFEPFFTTKDVGSGTGLGLSISQQLVRAHRGDLTVTSAPGAGATFRFWLPKSPEAG